MHAPDGQNARVISRSRSIVTGRPFNLAVAFEGSPILGRAFAESSFHHFLDYNWDPRGGAQAFVRERVGDAILREPAALASTHLSVRNVALWLAGPSIGKEGSTFR